MGCCPSRTPSHTTSQATSHTPSHAPSHTPSQATSHTTYALQCDLQGTIVSATTEFLDKLEYTHDGLIGQFVGILMTEFMSMLHRKFFLRMYADSRGVERNRLDNKLSALHHKRSLIIYDIARKAHIVTLSIKQSKSKDPQLELVFEFVEEPAGLFRTEIPVKTDGVFIESKSEVIVICMDFVGSTEMLSEMGVSATIDTNLRFYRNIIGLIRNKYYPFVYLHEVIGDSFIVVINADWAYTSDLFCATLSVKFVQDLVMATRHYITIRTGIAYGKIRYGTIGATFRMFGFPMNMSSRLETVCNPNEINICNKVNTKLLVEHAHLQIPTDASLKRTASLKGFGTTDYYTIPITEGTARE